MNAVFVSNSHCMQLPSQLLPTIRFDTIVLLSFPNTGCNPTAAQV